MEYYPVLDSHHAVEKWMDGIGWSDSMWQYFNIDIARNLKKDLLKMKKATFLSESTPLKREMLWAYFFRRVEDRPCQSRRVCRECGQGEKRDAAQWLGVDSQLVRSDFQHQLDPEQIVFWHCASHWAMTPWNDDIAGCILAHAQRQMPWRSFCFLFLNDPITQWMREHTEAQIKNI